MNVTPLAGKVVAIIGTGSDLDRAIAVACAEAGADLALGAETPAREHDYGMNSIANEIWALGREHFVLVLASPEDGSELVAEARARLGRCDALVTRDTVAVDIPVIAPDETGDATAQAVVRALAGQRQAPSPPLHAIGE